MNINNCKQWTDDIDEVIFELPELNILVNERIMITGCTGLICSSIIDILIRWNELHNEKIEIIASGRNESKIRERFEPYYKEEWFEINYYDAASLNTNMDVKCDYIIHGASNASPSNIVKEPVETMLSNILGINTLLDYAKENGVKRVVYISSSEVYGKKGGNEPFRINDYGFIDLLNSRNSYSVGKQAAETLCISYFEEYGVDSVIVRPGHIYGPTANSTDNRVSSSWAYDVARGKNIVMKSDGAQIRSYCYCLDCATAILKVLFYGKSAQAYNISNSKSVISIREMANILAESGNVQMLYELPTSEEKKGFNPMQNSSLDATELVNLGWRGIFDAKRGINHTVSILKEIL